MSSHPSSHPAYVELVFRLHDEGTREQFARQVNRQADGRLVAVNERPSGPLAEQALRAALAQGLLRRVRVDGPPTRAERLRQRG